MSEVGLPARALLWAVLLMFAPAVVGCGSSDRGDDGESDDRAVATEVATTPEQRAVLAARDQLVAAFAAGDARTYCAGITPATRRAEARFVGRPCEALIGAFAGRSPQDTGGRREARVVAVEVAGKRAVVVTRSPNDDQLQRTLFLKLSGRWRGEWRAEPTAKVDTSIGSN
jgi:hypothetical protein